MSDMQAQLIETANALLTGDATIEAFTAAGFGDLLLPESEGGFGGDWRDVQAVLRQLGYHQPMLDVAPIIIAPAQGDSELDGALATVALIGGALQRCLELSIEHANTRVQFGKALGRQQAVQQNLAALAEETAATAVAAQAAAKARDAGDALFEIGCAKIRANRAAAIGAAIAHQVHAAIGFTIEYPLHRYTRMLAQWRSAFGSESYWAERIGTFAAPLGGAGLWHEITRRGDSQAH